MNAHDYLWVQDPRQSVIAMAGCVTVVPNKARDEVLAAFGVDAAVPPRTVEEVGDAVWDWAAGPLVAPVEVPGAVVLVENNEFQGSRPEVLRAVSRVGAAFSVFWNVNALSQVSYAQSGEVIVAFEALFPEQRHGTDPDRLLPQMDGLPFGHPGEPIAAAFALAERVTGIRITPELISSAQQTWLVEPLLDELPAASPDWSADHHPLGRDRPELFAELIEASDADWRRVAGFAARHAATATGLDRQPEVVDVLRTASDSTAVVLSDAFLRLARRLSADADRAGRRHVGGLPSQGTHEAWSRVWAIRAIRAASDAHALAAALGGVYNGLYALAGRERQQAAFVDQVRGLIAP